MAKRRKRAAEQFPDERFAAVPEKTPEWLEAHSGFVEIDSSLATDEAPDEFRKAAAKYYDNDVDRNADQLWREIVDQRLDTPVRAGKVYEYAGRTTLWAAALKEIQIYKDREPVGWYDLDGGLVQYATLYDLAYQLQPMIVDDRKLFLMTEEMWENDEYPPEVGGKTTSKER